MRSRALIAWGGWDGHEPERGAALVAEMLREDGFDVRVEHGTAAFADEGLAGLDLIVPIITMSTMIRNDGNLLAFFERPIAAFLGIVTILIWLSPLILRFRRRQGA